MAKSYKRGKKGAGRFVQLPEWLLASPAWQDLKPGPRALYIELKRRFNGNNNGEVFLSHRDAAKALNVCRETVAGYYRDLSSHGFIQETRGHCLGPAGVGQSATYVLTEEPLNGTPATKDFMNWKKQKPRRINRHSLAEKPDTVCRKNQPIPVQMSKKSTAFAANLPDTVSEKPAKYTSNHIHTENVVVDAGHCEMLEAGDQSRKVIQ